MPLKELSLQGNVGLADVGAIKGAPLKVHKIMGTHGGGPTVTDFSPLAGMALETVVLDAPNKDVNVLKGMPLKSAHLSDAVTDISGLKGLQLKSISLHGANQLVNLSPLMGMPLESIDLYGVRATDLSPLSGMPLKRLDVPTQVSDLSALKDMPALESLSVAGSKVKDFSPLKAMKKLKSLQIADWNGSGFADITTLAGLPLEELNLCNTKVTDLGPVKNLPNLKSLTIQGLPISSLDGLKGTKLTTLNIAASKVADLTPLAGSPLKYLIACNCPNLVDLKPLAECKDLEGLTLPAKRGDIEFLRKMPKLKFLTADQRTEDWFLVQQTAEAFWKKYDAEKPKTP